MRWPNFAYEKRPRFAAVQAQSRGGVHGEGRPVGRWFANRGHPSCLWTCPKGWKPFWWKFMLSWPMRWPIALAHTRNGPDLPLEGRAWKGAGVHGEGRPVGRWFANRGHPSCLWTCPKGWKPFWWKFMPLVAHAMAQLAHKSRKGQICRCQAQPQRGGSSWGRTPRRPLVRK